MLHISIVVPAYNVEKYITRCLDSLFSQTASSDLFETIVINDGSSDKTGELLTKYQEEHPYRNFSVFWQSNAGLSEARNAGLKKAQGEYVWFVDADDWIAPNSVEKINACIQNENPEIIAIRARTGDQGEERNVLPHVSKGMDLLKTNNWSPCAPFYIYKRSFLECHKLSFFPGIYHEDLEFTPRVLYLASKISYVDDVLYNVVVNPNSITRSFNPKKSFDYLIVADNLISFVNSFAAEDKQLFCETLSILINNSLSELSNADKETVDSFNSALSSRPSLLENLKTTSIIKYKVEYILFKVFKPKYFQVYTLLKSFNKNGRHINR